jgi:hypothetical protein
MLSRRGRENNRMIGLKRASGASDLISGYSGPLFSATSTSQGISIFGMLPWLLVLLLSGLLLVSRRSVLTSHVSVDSRATSSALGAIITRPGKLFVSYSYFEKDEVQVRP